MYITEHINVVQNDSHEETGPNRGILNDAVLLQAKRPAEEAAQEAGLGEGLGEQLDDSVSKDSLWEETVISCQCVHSVQCINGERTLKSWSHVDVGQHTINACRK